MNNPCTLIVPPNIIAMISGVKTARIFPSGVVRLQYVDGSCEDATLTPEEIGQGSLNFLSLVSSVQQRRKAQGVQP